MPEPRTDEAFQRNVLQATIRIGGLVLLLLWCREIIGPFVTIGVWAIVLSIALQPMYARLKQLMGGSDRLSVGAIVLAGLVLVLVPTLYLLGSVVHDADGLGKNLTDGTLTLPALPESVVDAPLIGHRIDELWTAASANPSETLGPTMRKAAQKVLGAAANLTLTVLQFAVAFVGAMVLILKADGASAAGYAIARSLLGADGDKFADLAANTVRSVARGVLGVAILEGLIIGISLKVLGVPGAGLLGLAGLVLAVVQVPAPLLVIAVAIGLFATGSSGAGVVAIVVSVVVAIVDNVLKPILLGRGVQVPTLIILVGAIGGTLSMGILGLFVGPIVLVVGYTLLEAWIRREGAPVAPAATP